jgi:hypothetical protein
MPIITKPNEHFDVLTWTGTGGSSGATRSITGLNFQPGLIWEKARTSGTGHQLLDSVRGVGQNKVLASNSAGDEPEAPNTESLYGWMSAINSGGFTLTNGTSTFDNWNKSGDDYVAWNWKAGTSSSITVGQYGSGVPSIASTVSANPTAGFSIVTYTGNVTGGATIGHGLGAVPTFIIVKNRSTSANWLIYSSVEGPNKYGYLNLTNGWATDTTGFNNVTPTSTVFTVGSAVETNGSTNNLVAYCFTPIAGYSAFGSYTGNGSATAGPFVYLGFRPRLVMIKRYDTTSNWNITDTSRNPYNNTTVALRPNTGDTESTVGTVYVQPVSNGFYISNNNSDTNATNGTYIYAAFAEAPFKFANAR